jgi:hypothetical protein
VTAVLLASWTIIVPIIREASILVWLDLLFHYVLVVTRETQDFRAVLLLTVLDAVLADSTQGNTLDIIHPPGVALVVSLLVLSQLLGGHVILRSTVVNG